MMMRSTLLLRSAVVGLIVSLPCLIGCPTPNGDGGNGGQGSGTVDGAGGTEETDGTGDTGKPVEPPTRAATAKAEDVDAAKKLLDGIGAEYTLLPGDLLTEIVIRDGSPLSGENIALFGRLTDLEKLQVLNFRKLNDEMTSQLTGLKNLKVLALTNSVIGDPTVGTIAGSFPNLTELDLSSNSRLTNDALKVISELGKLERLTLYQTRFNDLGTDYLRELKNLRVLDLRGNMDASNMTMSVLGELPKLEALKHRSTVIDDYGMEDLARSKTLNSLLIEDFAITDRSGQHIAAIDTLTQLEILRCPGYDTEGLLALKGMKLTRLTLRDLPVDDRAMEVFAELPDLTRLYLRELSSVSDDGLKNIESLKSLKLLSIWDVPQMTDATVDVIATLPNLKELTIRMTDVSDAAVDKLLAMPSLTSLTFKENGSVTPDGLKKLSSKEWDKLDIGSTE